jgi:hypothetical protein
VPPEPPVPPEQLDSPDIDPADDKKGSKIAISVLYVDSPKYNHIGTAFVEGRVIVYGFVPVSPVLFAVLIYNRGLITTPELSTTPGMSLKKRSSL